MQILTILIQSITQHSQMKTEVKIFSIQWFSFYASIRIEKKPDTKVIIPKGIGVHFIYIFPNC